MVLEEYSVIQLITERYQDRGVSIGAIGTILEVYGQDAYEVEFSRSDGTTIAWFAVKQNEVKPYSESTSTTISRAGAKP
ncbi:hypothetical protein DSM106972_037830 [Dulcicalothrix desertica PCC 7102]|uniref:DUF4926 domain-containing protein n=1 Tax=Dulcicalothrix desertica PCC 7102 TaxID=232991 RepID=A0A3S1CD89_9CYAN|nr:DUF4926 domain-containing protein [Dulcicalothrix desertica]RUT04962.1 hypothetical protein DSM106972_037830 [Dulcicalothrix desertica PCC 7102]TWH43816.1 uncharacterized protein DUF4926 [Dulcicalothrix desertica PCC 7102]